MTGRAPCCASSASKGVEERRIWQLSGGMRQRVGVARALTADPEVLLMDEPLGALDALTREQMQELILDIWARTKKSVFFITHGIDEAVFLATKLLVMSPRPGRVVASIDLAFGRQFADGAKAGEIKGRPEFIATRERVKALVFSSGQLAETGAVNDTPALATRRAERLRLPSLSLRRFSGGLTYVSKVSIATCVAAVLLWWLAARVEVVPAMFLPSPFAVAAKFFTVWNEGFQDATLLQHLAASVGRVTAALIAAVAFGVILGFAMNLTQTARGIIEPLLEFYRPIPPLAYLPLVIIWFGIGEFAKILVIFSVSCPRSSSPPTTACARCRRTGSMRRARWARPAVKSSCSCCFRTPFPAF